MSRLTFKTEKDEEGVILQLTNQDIFTQVQSSLHERTGVWPSTAGIKASIITLNHTITMKIVICPEAATHSQQITHQGGSQPMSAEIIILIIMVTILTSLIIIIAITVILIILVIITAIMIAVTIITVITQATAMTITNPHGTERDLTDMIT